MNKSEIKNILKQLKIAPLKRFGQNFLIDSNIAKKLISFLGVEKGDNVLEIGPGLGALTGFLLETGCNLTVVEVDKGFVKYLKSRFSEYDKFTLVEEDFLKLDLNFLFKINKKFKVISNLPYYITSPVIFKILEYKRYFSRAVFTMQKEVAQRIISKPGISDYSILSVKLQLQSEINKILDISKKAFYPEPAVVSSALLFEFLEKPRFTVKNMLFFEELLKKGFSQRRKQLQKTLLSIVHDKNMIRQVFDQEKIDFTARIEELEIERITTLSNRLYEIVKVSE